MKLQPQPASDPDNPMANSMKSMTYTMPLMSVFFGFTLPAGLGLYWAVSAMVRCVQQIAINKYLSTKSTEDLIKENQEKAAKKKKKRGTSSEEIRQLATKSTKSVEKKSRQSDMSEEERQKKLEKAASLNKNVKPGSLTDIANMVSRYNNSNHSKEEEKKK